MSCKAVSVFEMKATELWWRSDPLIWLASKQVRRGEGEKGEGNEFLHAGGKSRPGTQVLGTRVADIQIISPELLVYDG